jgi:hypothetical protein
VSGGAVEVAWRLFGPSGRACEGDACENTAVTEVRLCARPLDGTPAGTTIDADGCLEGGEFVYACKDGEGTTRFDVPAARYALTVDVRPTTVAASTPPPLVRDVRKGAITQLGVMQIVVRSPQLDQDGKPRCP